MAAFWLSRASRRLRFSASSFPCAQSFFTDPLSLASFRKPPIYSQTPEPEQEPSITQSSSRHDFDFFRLKFVVPSPICRISSSSNINSSNGTCLVRFYTDSSSDVSHETKKCSSEGEESSNIQEFSWIDSYLPKSVRPYARLARLDKPIGTWLLAWPCMWSITLAASPGNLPDVKMLSLFACGALLLRGAGCTINDLLDRDIDTKVERTKLRPVASGLLTPFQGLSFLGFQLLLGLGILLQLNNYSCILGASSLLLVFSYPLMKRITFWPQAYLGLTFNWGALLGWAAVRGSLAPNIVIPLYMSGVFWTLVYDTIYAHQDKEDDLKVGVKSTALKFGDQTKNWITGFRIACISCLGISGYNAEIGWPYYAFLTAASGQLAWQIWTVDLSSRADCNKKFVSNKWFGAIIFGGILFGRLTS